MRRATVAVLTPIVASALLAILTIARPTGSGPVSYRLETRQFEVTPVAESKSDGPMGHIRTEYKYFEVDGSGHSRLLWSQTLREIYGRHWISPNGRLWVLSDSSTDNRKWGTSSSIWVRDVAGIELATWNSSAIGLKTPVNGNWQQSKLITDDAKLLSFKGDKEEQLYLPTIDGKGTCIDIAWLAGDRANYALHRDLPETGDLPAFAQSIKDPRYGLPTVTAFNTGTKRLDIWETKSGSDKLPDKDWIECYFPQDRGATGMPDYSATHAVPRAPDKVLVTPAMRYVWFEWPSNRYKNATLRIFDPKGAEFKAIDLQAMGGFKSAAEAEMCIKWQQISALGDQGYKELGGELPQWRFGVPDHLDMFDTQGRRYVIVADGSRPVTAQLYSGVAARRPFDERNYPETISRESFIYSPNREFKLRLRQTEAPNKLVRETLLATVTDHGRPVDVEMWTGISGEWPEAPQVSDSGRVVAFYLSNGRTYSTDPKTGKTNDVGMQDHAVLSVADTDGHEIAGIDLLAPENGFHSNEEVRKGIAMDRLRIESTGHETRAVEGVTVPKAKGESYTIVYSNGDTKKYEIGYSQYMHTDVLMNRQPNPFQR